MRVIMIIREMREKLAFDKARREHSGLGAKYGGYVYHVSLRDGNIHTFIGPQDAAYCNKIREGAKRIGRPVEVSRYS